MDRVHNHRRSADQQWYQREAEDGLHVEVLANEQNNCANVVLSADSKLKENDNSRDRIAQR